MSLIRKAFQRLHYPVDIIAQCVRWYLAYSLSLRDLEEMMAERGIVVDHSTLHRWVLRLVPLITKAFSRYKRPVSQKWHIHIDETYIKIKGQWRYLYRAIDSFNAGFSRYKPITTRQNKYLNNRIEQDHRGIKRRTKGMLGFKAFRSAQILLAGIELMHMLRKNQFSVADDSLRSRADQFRLLVA